jgi:hypothetical protein
MGSQRESPFLINTSGTGFLAPKTMRIGPRRGVASL